MQGGDSKRYSFQGTYSQSLLVVYFLAQEMKNKLVATRGLGIGLVFDVFGNLPASRILNFKASGFRIDLDSKMSSKMKFHSRTFDK